MNKKLLLFFSALSLCACVKQPQSTTTKLFENKKWTKWCNQDESLVVYVTGGYAAHYDIGVGYFDADSKELYKACFNNNVDGGTLSYLGFYSSVNGEEKIICKYKIEMYFDGLDYSNDIIQVYSDENTKYTTLRAQPLNEQNIDARILYDACFRSEEYNLSFFCNESENTTYTNVNYINNKDEEFKLFFYNDNRFVLRNNSVDYDGSYSCDHTKLVLSFNTICPFPESTKLSFKILFLVKGYARDLVS